MFGLARKPPLGTVEQFGLLGRMPASIIGPISNRKIYSLQGFTELVTFGDSIAAGSNASPSTNAFRALLASKYGLTDSDQSVGGRGYYEQAAAVNSGSLNFTRTETLIIDETGLNDLRRSVSELTFNKMETCLRCMLTRAMSATGMSGGNAAITRTGTFTSFQAATVGGSYGTSAGALPDALKAATSSTIGDTYAWTFTGYDNFYIHFSGSFDGTNARGICQVYCDGILLETVNLQGIYWDGVSDGTNDNKRGPVSKVYWGFDPNVTHQVVVKIISNANVPIDKVGNLGPPESGATFFLLEIPKVNDYNKPGLTKASDFWIDYANARRINVLNEFKSHGYKCEFIPLNASSGGYYTQEGIDATDYVHLLNKAHYDSFRSIDRYLTKWG